MLLIFSFPSINYDALAANNYSYEMMIQQVNYNTLSHLIDGHDGVVIIVTCVDLVLCTHRSHHFISRV